MSTPVASQASLENDVNFLREILAQVLLAQLGPDFLARSQEVVRLSKNARQGDEKSSGKLLELLRALAPEEALPLARAGSLFLTLANAAENHHRLRRRRSYELDAKSSAQPGSCEAVIRDLVGRGYSKEKVFNCICKMRLDLVLTAHPTETMLPSLQKKNLRISRALAERDRPDLTPAEKRELDEFFFSEITSLWLTPDVRETRPTPIDEALSGLATIEQVLWYAVPQFMRSLDNSLFEHTAHRLPLINTPIRFDSWMGGDRDGNPSVTAEITKKVVYLSRWRGAKLYIRELTALNEELTFPMASPDLASVVGDSVEPYQVILGKLRKKLVVTEEHYYQLYTSSKSDAEISEILDDKNEFLRVLLLCRESLCATGARVVASRRLADLIRRLNVFGLGLARLDVRQEASRHSSLIAAIAQANGLGDFQDMAESARQKFLVGLLENPSRTFSVQSLNADDQETFNTFKALIDLPRESLGSYIISMARSPSDILAVEFLQVLTGAAKTLPVVPLFEQVEDLRTAGETLELLFSVPWYKTHISHVGFAPRQQVMIGYSDSAKSAGRLSASWELYKAQESIRDVCARHGVVPTLFHGRGGAVSRGGAPTYTAIASLPPGLVQNSMRVTEQGETIMAKFGLAGLAIRNMELYASAVLEATIKPESVAQGEWRAEMDRLAEISEVRFRDVVEDDKFVEYFKTATPEPELSLLRIGSRPARRSKSGGLKSLRAIPWSFAWTQTRLHLPAWLGFDRALSDARKDGRLKLLTEMYQKWSFFRSTMDLIEMVLAKTELTVAARYDQVLVDEKLLALGRSLRASLEEVRTLVLEVTQHEYLLEENPTIKHLIAVRNPYVDPLNFLQVELLRKYREREKAIEAKEQPEVSHPDNLLLALLTTINGIAAGMRNTG